MPLCQVSGDSESAVGYCGQCVLNAKIKSLNFIQLALDIEKRLKRSGPRGHIHRSKTDKLCRISWGMDGLGNWLQSLNLKTETGVWRRRGFSEEGISRQSTGQVPSSLFLVRSHIMNLTDIRKHNRCSFTHARSWEIRLLDALGS